MNDEVIVRLRLRRENLPGLLEGIPVIRVWLESVEGDLYDLRVQGFKDDMPIAPRDWQPDGMTSPLREVVRAAIATSPVDVTLDEQTERIVSAIRALLEPDAMEEQDEG